MVNKKADYNVEVAHIYMDRRFSKEQIQSVRTLRRLLQQKDLRLYTVGVLFDDYSPSDTSLDIEQFLRQLAGQGLQIDFYAYESGMAPYVAEFIKTLPLRQIRPEKRKPIGNGKRHDAVTMKTFTDEKGKIGLLDRSGRPTCAVMTTVWYLMRLGVYPPPAGLIRLTDMPFAGRKLITVLPSYYRTTEAKALRLIKASVYAKFLDSIEYEYFDVKS